MARTGRQLVCRQTAGMSMRSQFLDEKFLGNPTDPVIEFMSA